MTAPRTSREAEFDAFAGDYESALEQGIRLSGEDSTYFARTRVEWVARRLEEHGVQPRNLLDFGCGTGSTTPFLLGMPGADRLVGVDVSPELLRRAEQDHGSAAASFRSPDAGAPSEVDVAYTNG